MGITETNIKNSIEDTLSGLKAVTVLSESAFKQVHYVHHCFGLGSGESCLPREVGEAVAEALGVMEVLRRSLRIMRRANEDISNDLRDTEVSVRKKIIPPWALVDGTLNTRRQYSNRKM